jgi:O-antigen/teichoic acid export membrane protein
VKTAEEKDTANIAVIPGTSTTAEEPLIVETVEKPAKGLRAHGDLFTNAGSLVAASAITSLLGFAYWWLAARIAPTEAVGQASAAVAAMTLIGTIGMFGMGTMLISELPKMAGRRWNLITTCLLVSGAVATVGGIGYVVAATLWVPGLRDALGDHVATGLLIAGITLSAMTLVLDEALVGLLAGPLQLLRNTYFAVAKLAALGVIAFLPIALTGGELLMTWIGGIVLSVALLSVTLKRRKLVDSARPRLKLLKGMGKATFDNNLLNLATFLPRAAMPLVVVAVLSAEANAAFYTAWMVLAFIAMVPGNVALTLFAVASGDRALLRSKVRMGLLICLGLGIPGSAVVYFGAEYIMGIFGEAYAKSAGGALAIMALMYVPFVFHHFFLAVSRVQNRVRGAGIFSIFAGLAELVAAYWGGRSGSLTTLVWCVLAVMVAETVLVAPTVLRVVFPGRGRNKQEGIMRTRRMALRERMWLPFEYIRTVGPLTGVTADGLRKALIGLHDTNPAHRAVSRLDRDTARWQELDADTFAAYVKEAVTPVTGSDAKPDAMSRRLQAEPRAHHPVRILVGGGYVAIKVAHAYGDAGPVNTLVRELILAAAEGRSADFVDAGPKRPLRRGLWKQFGPRRGRLNLRAAVQLAAPPAPSTEDARPWQADITVRTTRSTEALGRMRAWRDEHAPGTTTAAISFAAFTGALKRVGFTPDETGGVFLFDARRYVPDGAGIGGNFCWGQYLTPSSLTDPQVIHKALKAELASGRILAMMGLKETKIAVAGASGWPAAYPTETGAEPRPRLTFSNQGRHDVLADLPWSAGNGKRVNHSVPTLSSPEGITLTTSEMGGALHLEATFHASTYDPALVQRALELVCAEPADLVDAPAPVTV